MRTGRLLFMVLALGMTAGAQPAATSVGRAPARTEFVSYDLRESAESRVRDKAGHVVTLNGNLTKTPTGYAIGVEIPWTWADRVYFLHIQGEGAPLRIYVDDIQVGYTDGDRTPAEFDVTPYMDEGIRMIVFEPVDGGAWTAGDIYLYSQPRARIEDYRIVCSDAWIDLNVALSNGYNYEEQVAVGYDIYDPAGKLLYYNRRDVTLPGSGRDTVRFNEYIPGTGKYLWTPQKPELFRVMLHLRQGGRVTEYIPFNIGFTAKEPYVANLDAIKAASGRIVTYNAAEDAVKTKAELTALRKNGTDMIRVGYPQPSFFYDLCDLIGMRVIDQADIDRPEDRDDLRVGGTPSNDPALVEAWLERQRYMLERTKNRTCVVGWSPGTMSGNGYNMQRAYQLLRELDPTRPVVYDDARGEWNSDAAW